MRIRFEVQKKPFFQKYHLPPGIYEKGESNKILTSSFDEIRFKIVLNAQCDENEIKFDKKSSFILTLRLTDNKYWAGKHMVEKLVNLFGRERTHLKLECEKGSILNGKRQNILHKFGTKNTWPQSSW